MQRLILEKEGVFKTIIVNDDKCLRGYKVVGFETLDKTEVDLGGEPAEVTKPVAKKTTKTKTVVAKKEEVTKEDLEEKPVTEKPITFDELRAYIKDQQAERDKNMDDVRKMYKVITGKDGLKLNDLIDVQMAKIVPYIEENW